MVSAYRQCSGPLVPERAHGPEPCRNECWAASKASACLSFSQALYSVFQVPGLFRVEELPAGGHRQVGDHNPLFGTNTILSLQ
jgi:hypothetical protein